MGRARQCTWKRSARKGADRWDRRTGVNRRAVRPVYSAERSLVPRAGTSRQPDRMVATKWRHWAWLNVSRPPHGSLESRTWTDCVSAPTSTQALFPHFRLRRQIRPSPDPLMPNTSASVPPPNDRRGCDGAECTNMNEYVPFGTVAGRVYASRGTARAGGCRHACPAATAQSNTKSPAVTPATNASHSS